MANIPSNQISVFPAVRRSSSALDIQRDSRLFTEKTLISLTTRFTDNDSYMITKEINAFTDPVEFVVNGYYFKVDKVVYITQLFTISRATSIWASITLDEANGYPEIASGDENSKYMGLTFSVTEPADAANLYKLKLFTVTSNDPSTAIFTIPDSSKIKFAGDSVDIDIDGGII